MSVKVRCAFFCLCLMILPRLVTAQLKKTNLTNPFAPQISATPFQLQDLDKDGDPDVLRTFLNDTVPVQWIDDDDDMKESDVQGDTDNDCMMIDRNRDKKYGDEMDLIIDWVDDNSDGKADLQIIADNAKRTDKGWTPGHFMIVIDTDNDGVFHFINWHKLELEAWAHEGTSRFFQDYAGQSLFLKIHTSVFNIADPRFNWENPFLFYDPDGDGLSEMTIRLMAMPVFSPSGEKTVSLERVISDARLSVDLDNDNRYGNEFDFDFSLRFFGPGFDYSNHIHRFKKMRGLPAADSFFYNPSWRQMTELIYVDHASAFKTILNKGVWSACWLVFDEDDDCERWERVEFYDPKNLFAIGARNGGLDNNPQADAVGDRGEWDTDNSGGGSLYIGRFDGKIHLFGAESGAWRIDQGARYYQGWQGWRNGADTIVSDNFIEEPLVFPTIRYADRNNNGFFDEVSFDMDGDTLFEQIISLPSLGISDISTVYSIKNFSYKKFQALFEKASSDLWKNATLATRVANRYNIPLAWYRFFTQGNSLQQKYHNGFWLNFFIYQDLRKKALERKDSTLVQKIDVAYFTSNWRPLLPSKLKR